MGDRSIKKLDLKDAVVAVKGVIKWYDLGLQLGLPEYTLDLIATHHDIEDHLRMMLSKSLRYDSEASWEKLADASSIIGEKATAENIRHQFMGKMSIPDPSGCQSDVKIRK